MSGVPIVASSRRRPGNGASHAFAAAVTLGRELAERSAFAVCAAAGWLLRSARYSTIRIDHRDVRCSVRKRRRFHAPLLVWLSGPVMRLLRTGVRILPQREWEQRERDIYQCLYGASMRIDADGELVLPRLAGETLASLLEHRELDESTRQRAIELAVLALADFHARGFTHGDAMAENVMIDLDAGVARWFDFETVHEHGRPWDWRRADDLRALLTTCLVRIVPSERATTLHRILDLCADNGVTRMLAARFTAVCRRTLIVHLGQAGLSRSDHRQIIHLLTEHRRTRQRRHGRGHTPTPLTPHRP